MSTFASRRLRDIRDNCIRLSEESASEDGFVQMHSLVTRFDAEVIFRPLLVEALVARNTDLKLGGPKWKILLDSERFTQDEKIYKDESSKQRLSVRARNTIAHELIHTFQFKIKKDQIIPDRVTDKTRRSDSTVRFLEKEAHALTPLLLIPKNHFIRSIKDLSPESNAQSFDKIQKIYGTSKEIFIQALNRLRIHDDPRLLSLPSIVDTWIGIGYWDSNLNPHFKCWPKFSNFKSGSLPDFIWRNLDKKHATFTIPDLSIPTFFNSAGNTTKIIAYEGSRIVPEHCKVAYEISREARPPKENNSFIFLLRRKSVIA